LTVTSLAARPYTHVRSLLFTVPVAFDHGVVGVDHVLKSFDLQQPHALEQLDARHMRLDGAPSDQTGDGWVRGVSNDVVVTAVRRWFAEEWPQRLAVDASGLGVDVLAGHDDAVELGMGAAKTFELWLAFDDRGHSGDPVRLAQEIQHPLVAQLDPA